MMYALVIAQQSPLVWSVGADCLPQRLLAAYARVINEVLLTFF